MTAGEGKNFSEKFKTDFKESDGLDFLKKNRVHGVGLWSLLVKVDADHCWRTTGGLRFCFGFGKLYKDIFQGHKHVDNMTIAQNIEVKNIWLQVHICVNWTQTLWRVEWGSYRWFYTEKKCFNKKKVLLPVPWTFGQSVSIVIATDLRFSDLDHG